MDRQIVMAPQILPPRFPAYRNHDVCVVGNDILELIEEVNFSQGIVCRGVSFCVSESFPGIIMHRMSMYSLNCILLLLKFIGFTILRCSH